MVIRVYGNKNTTTKGEYISRYLISPSPHISSGQSVAEIMWIVSGSLIPVIISSIYYFGITSFYLITVAIISSIAGEVISNILKKEESNISDGSAFLTGLLLALTLPPAMPLTKVAIGSFFAIVIGKQVFGGLGYNIFNPALLGRAFLQVSFPVEMTSFHDVIGVSNFQFLSGVDGVTSATALAKMKFDKSLTDLFDLFTGNIAGAIGETSSAAILLGVVVLIYKRYINLLVPISLLLTVAIIAYATHVMDPTSYAEPLFHLFSGGIMLGTFYMATDMVTSPVTNKGAMIFGAGIGAITMLIRIAGGMTEGFMYSVLIMNALVPLLNRYTRPLYFGESKK